MPCQSSDKPDSGTECCIFFFLFWHRANAFGLSSPKRGWRQVFDSAVSTTQEPSNPWVRCNIFTGHVLLERCFEAAVFPACRGTAKGFLGSHCTISEEITALDIKEPLREWEQLHDVFVDRRYISGSTKSGTSTSRLNKMV